MLSTFLTFFDKKGTKKGILGSFGGYFCPLGRDSSGGTKKNS
jgi:hypothetical protein